LQPLAQYNAAMSIGTPHFETLSGFSPSSTLGPHRAADYWSLPEGAPVELIQGRLVVSPSPNDIHQTISALLTELLLRSSRQGRGRMFAAPMDVVLSDLSIVQPDLIYVAKERRGIVKGRVMGPPDLIIEIVSKNDARRDRVDKMNLYAQHGVSEYWIVDPEARQFDFLINRNGRFEVQPQQDDRYQSPRLAELAIHLADFWAEVQRCVDDGPSA
jgi:Uma2 family endonuclease